MKHLITYLSLLFGGCATILGGGNSTELRATSEPAGAQVYANGSMVGKTPTTLIVDKRKDQHLEFKLDGYENKNVLVTSGVQGGWVVADIFLGGLIGVVVDAATGSWNGLDREHVNAALEKKEGK